jgi:hypothetical protein
MLNTLLPLVKPLHGSNCSKCDRSQAVWADPADAARSPICSLCVLYDSKVWDKSFETIISEVELARSTRFERSADMRIFRCSDADHVVGVLALSARVAAIGAKAKTQVSK